MRPWRNVETGQAHAAPRRLPAWSCYLRLQAHEAPCPRSMRKTVDTRGFSVLPVVWTLNKKFFLG